MSDASLDRQARNRAAVKRYAAKNKEKIRLRALEYVRRPKVKEKKAEQMQQYIRDPRLRPKHEARWKAHYAIAMGRLVRQPCCVCGVIPADAHHEDYMKPLEVIWLCRPCHVKRDAELRRVG